MAETDYKREIDEVQGKIDRGTKRFSASDSYIQTLQRASGNMPHVRSFLEKHGLERHGRNLF